MKRTKYILSLAIGLGFLAGCAGTMPKGDAEFENRIQQVVDSLSKEEALDYYLNGSILEESGDYYKAAYYYQVALLYDQGSPAIINSLGSLYANLGEMRAALLILENGHHQHPEDDDIASSLMKTYFHTGLLLRADRLFNNIQSRRQLTEIETEQYLALLVELKKYDDALELSLKQEKRFGQKLWLHENRARIYLMSGNIEAAGTTLKKIAELDPQNHVAFYLLGDFAAQEGNWAEAAQKFRLAVEIEPENVQYWVNLAAALAELDDSIELLNLTEQALRLFPQEPRFYDMRAGILESMGRNEEALELLEKSISLNSARLTPYLNKAYLYHQLQAWDKSEAAYEQALLVAPDNALVLNNFAYMLAVSNNRIDEALEMVNRALELEPENLSYIDTRAWVYYRLGRYKDALREIQKVVDQEDARSGELYEHLGFILKAMNRNEEAKEAWRNGLKLDPENEELRRLAE